MVSACEKDELRVQTDSEVGGDYGRSELLAAIETYTAAKRTPEAYRKLATDLDALRERFHAEVAADAERNLVILALEPLKSQFDAPLAEQAEILATTVWPTALEVEPLPDETPQAYMERICGAQLALVCKSVASQYRELVLAREVWERFKDRAREAVQRCQVCDGNFAAVVTEFERHENQLSQRLGALDGAEEISNWPIAGANASTWAEPPLFEVAEDGSARLTGQPVAPGQWLDALRALDTEREVLGVYLRPTARVRVLQAVVNDAREAGFAELALLARDKEYPYTRRQYRLPLRSRVRLPVRDFETIQVLMQALDAAAAPAGRGA